MTHVHPTTGRPLTPLSAPPPQPVRFDGSCCVNVRSISAALDVLDGTGRAGTPISRAELTSFLWFVEMCVTSRAIYFDGTVPPDDVAATVEQTERLALHHAIDELKVSPIRFQSDADILLNARAAVIESSFLLSNVTIDRAVDQPLKPSEHEFFARVLRQAIDLDESTRQERALELISQQFRGSKCAAALIAAGPIGLALAESAYEAYPDEGPRVTGALINRFRLNYLNQLAGWRAGIYAPDPGFETFTREHARLFKDYLLEQVSRDIHVRHGDSNLLAENMQEATPLPPIGLYALMLTREKGKPIAVLNTALERFKHHTGLQQLIWDRTEEGLRLRATKPDLDAYATAVDAHFQESYAKIDRESRGIAAMGTSPGTSLRKYVIPALLSAGAGLIPGAGTGLAGLAFKLLSGTVAGASVQWIADNLIGGGCNSYLSQYRGLTYDFEKNPALAQPVAAVASRVEEVFGRPLA